MLLGCGSEWTVPGLLSHDFFPLSLSPPDKSQILPKLRLKLLSWLGGGTLRKEAATGNPTLGDLENLVTFQSSFSGSSSVSTEARIACSAAHTGAGCGQLLLFLIFAEDICLICWYTASLIT